MGLIGKLMRHEDQVDSLVTLRVDESRPLEERIHLLSYTFAKIVQGAILKQIVTWDICNGCVKFVVSHGPANPNPTGTVFAHIENYPPQRVEVLVESIESEE